MNQVNQANNVNAVNSSPANTGAASPDRANHAMRQMIPNRQQATARIRGGHVRQMTSDRTRATVCMDENILITAWNVNTLHQAGKYENLKRKRRRMGLDIVGVSETRWTGV